MCAVGPTTTTRATRPARSISWATRRPKVVLPAAGVADARKLAPSCSPSSAAASRCHARSGRVDGQSGRVRERVEVVIEGRRPYVRPRSEARRGTLGRVPILLAVAAGLALADASIVALALPPILRELDTTVTGVASVLGVYVLVLAAALPGAAVLERRHGAARVGTAGLGLFAAASLLCAAAGSLPVLLAGRALQAAGGAAGLLAAFTLLDAGGRGRRLWVAAAVFGTAAGPALGGLLTQLFDWRAIFIVQAPVAIAAAVVAARSSHTAVPAPARSPFPAGPAAAMALVSASLTAVLFLLVLELVAGWSVEPLAAALAVTVLPVTAILASRAPGTAAVRASCGALLIAAGTAALAFLPDASIAW